MIQAVNITRKFETVTALDAVSLTVDTGRIFGLVGSNGAGKSTLMRVMSGVLTPDSGQILIDGRDTAHRPSVRRGLVYVPDDLYFLPNAGMDRMAQLCRSTRGAFDGERYEALAEKFGADRKKPLRTMSKGMKRQAALILALSSRPDILLIDETFDGLDVIRRQGMRELLCEEVAERGMTVILATHSMREVDDLCDTLAMLHQGHVTLQSELDEAKSALVKVQIAFNEAFDRDTLDFEGARIVHFEKNGGVATVVYENERQQVEYALSAMNPVLLTVLPVSLEEVFIYRCQ